MNKNTMHGHAQKFNLSPEYRAWQGMKARCYRVTEPKYKDYGARGIRVCEQWLLSFTAFLADVGKRPSGNYSLGRKDNDGDYTPENVSWQTAKEQANNRRLRIDSVKRRQPTVETLI